MQDSSVGLEAAHTQTTGLFLLERYLTDENADALLCEARGKSRRELEMLIACRFPRPDVAPTIQALGGTAVGSLPNTSSGPTPELACPGTGTSPRPQVEPLSAERYRFDMGVAFSLSILLLVKRMGAGHAPAGDEFIGLSTRCS